MSIVGSLVRRLGFGRLAENTLLAIVWQSVRVLSLALWVVIVARQLGVDGYGSYSGVAGLATALGGFSGVGLGLVMYQEVVRDPAHFNQYWHHALRFTLLSGIALCLAFVAAASSLFAGDISLFGLIGLAISEIIAVPIVSLGAFAFAAFERIGSSTALPAVNALSRLLAAVAFMWAPGDRSINRYILYHVIGIAVGAGLAFSSVNLILRPGRRIARPSNGKFSEGLGFAAVWSVNTALGSLDKSLVLKLAGNQIAGIYSAAYRIASVLALPVEALTTAATPRLFGEHEGTKHKHLLRNLLIAVLAYALIGSALLWGSAELLPILLGPEFQPTSSAARALVMFLPFYSFRLLGSNILLARGNKMFRVLSDGGAILFLSLIAWLLVPRFGLFGALWAVTAAEAFLASAQWLFIWHTRRSPRAPSASNSAAT